MHEKSLLFESLKPLSNTHNTGSPSSKDLPKIQENTAEDESIPVRTVLRCETYRGESFA